MNIVKTRLYKKWNTIFLRTINLILYIEGKIAVNFITKTIIDNFWNSK